MRTVVWVVAVVAVTMVLSLLLAQLFNERFPGRRVARWALIAPWAASVMMTALVFRWALDANNGVDQRLPARHRRAEGVQLERGRLARPAHVRVRLDDGRRGVRVAAVLDVRAARRPAGDPDRRVRSSACRRRHQAGGRTRSITLPLLRPAFLVAALINIINVFNSFPIIWEMTRGGPGYATSTTTTFMFLLKQSYIGESASMSVINFGLVILLVALFLRATRWKDQVG